MTEHPAIAFARAVLHGDEEHRAWLMEAAKAFVEGRPLPAVRADTTSPRRPGGAEAMREAAAKVAELWRCRNCGRTFHPDDNCVCNDPDWAGPLSQEEIAAAIRSLPLPAGDTLSTGGEDPFFAVPSRVLTAEDDALLERALGRALLKSVKMLGFIKIDAAGSPTIPEPPPGE